MEETWEALRESKPGLGGGWLLWAGQNEGQREGGQSAGRRAWTKLRGWQAVLAVLEK